MRHPAPKQAGVAPLRQPNETPCPISRSHGLRGNAYRTRRRVCIPTLRRGNERAQP